MLTESFCCTFCGEDENASHGKFAFSFLHVVHTSRPQNHQLITVAS